MIAMIAMMAESFANIILDYVFIFPMETGVFGKIVCGNENQICAAADPSLHAETGLIRRFCAETQITDLSSTLQKESLKIFCCSWKGGNRYQINGAGAISATCAIDFTVFQNEKFHKQRVFAVSVRRETSRIGAF